MIENCATSVIVGKRRQNSGYMMTRTPGSSKDALKGLEGLPGKMEGNEIGLGVGAQADDTGCG